MTTAEQEYDPQQDSIAGLVRHVTELVPRLVREEVALAKAEATEKAKHAGAGAGSLSAAGVLAFYAVGVLIAAGVLGLAEALPGWAAALVVAAVLLVLGGILALVGRNQLKRAVPPMPTEAVESAKRDVQAVKESVRR